MSREGLTLSFLPSFKKILDKNEAKIVKKPEKDISSSLLQPWKTAFYLAAGSRSFTVSVHVFDLGIS